MKLLPELSSSLVHPNDRVPRRSSSSRDNTCSFTFVVVATKELKLDEKENELAVEDDDEASRCGEDDEEDKDTGNKVDEEEDSGFDDKDEAEEEDGGR